MKIKEIKLHQLLMTMKKPFTTSFGTQQKRFITIVEAIDEDGVSGFGECVSGEDPLYSEEFMDATLIALKKYFGPLVINKEISHPDEVWDIYKPFKRNNMAKACIEGAVWDLYAKKKGITLAAAMGGKKKEVDVGVSLGLEDTDELLLERIGEKVEEGYKRIKVKIKPGRDVEMVGKIREVYPDIPLMVDANSAYTLDDIDTLKALDEYNLMMIEQPLMAGDIIDHAKLQKQIKTPVCLDESIDSYESAAAAIEMGSCKIINVKVGRVGGITQSIKIHDLAEKHGIPLWCGGMLEAGVGRLHNVAITTLSNFVLPGDTASSSRYWFEDIITPEVVAENGVVKVSDAPGIGAEIDFKKMEQYLVKVETITEDDKLDMIMHD
ncbi:o-succinylbenzoate synthase [Jeotgalicoccus aerolatus]|uniref:o-succinylbenzoate synthase n=1 Tax=Jeotgalicoccus aerolatus TaxID=709510 RepID=A0ABS4HN58_9STAP|nr:o-succinylbenzoate synthase [Jeotgalicoccus aerolatus]MBP1952144.1 O-succinylbenzoate synthase [Jeotgalicoccus aerolatus]GGE06242.1 o-succinylbenzoate synthase [Jeotgalicoccus aerolatus]CAD2070833.1 o-succinylbenzoate synthase [Jeotgalicoccus aerolatus]